eukprot:TRINITY_DN803_c0_g1_i2.p1 TRINITY_DN803_c0_g1~~TRINITY_DN803_c0_g1_i2.p1  ORF type:complete len:222 (+),score=28.83 TRINITY_DN803_c0_g1_i2:147-812(+)
MGQMEKCPVCNKKNQADFKFCTHCAYKNEKKAFTTASCSYQFVMLGQGGVGKSAITIRFALKHFEAKYDPTIEDCYQKVVDHQEVPCFLEILDTAGQETFTALRELYMQNGQGFALVYSITSLPTLKFLDKIYRQILDFQPSDIPLVLVGNKLDLADKRKVSHEVARAKADDWHCQLFETSAKTDENIEAIFHGLIQACWDREGGPPKTKSSRSGMRCALL